MNVIDVEQGSVIHPSENAYSVLTIVTLTCSSIGIALSGGALALLFTTAFLFTEWRQNYKNQLIIQLMTSRFIYTFVRYLYDIRNIFKFCDNIECIIYLDVLSMVYTELALVSWMFVFSRHMYECLVKVFVERVPSIWRVCVWTWTAPAVVSILYHLVFKLKNSDEIASFFVYNALFKWPILTANCIQLILVLKSIIKTNISKAESNLRIVLVMIFLIFMFGLQQVLLDCFKIIHLLVLHEYPVSSYMLIASHIFLFYHCAFSIIFWVFGNAKTRKLWRLRFNPPSNTNITEDKNKTTTL